jgi:hypothetical protein
MTTWYDEEIMDWAGIMDEDQFYAECDRSNARFFRKLITAWTTQPGCSLEWVVWGASLFTRINGNKVEVCTLAPQCQRAGTKDHLTLTRATYMSHVDKDRAEKREKEVCAAAGRQTEIGTTRIDSWTRGHSSRTIRQP